MQDLLLQIQETVRAYREARDNLENLSLQRIKELHSLFTSEDYTLQFLNKEAKGNLTSLISKLEARIPKQISDLRYIVMPRASNYAKGVKALKNDCLIDSSNAQPTFSYHVDPKNSSLWAITPRPLTFEENIKARVDDYETLFDENGNERDLNLRTRLFNTYLDSCTGIAYKAKTTKFKIVTECSELINIASNFNEHYLPIDYGSINGIELDSSQGIYNQLLTPKQILEHPAWNEFIKDKSLLKTYIDLFFKLKPRDVIMGFGVRRNTAKDELRALFVNIVNNSSAGGDNSLISSAYFLRVTQKAP
ncbi:MAG: hypothetical protein KKB39_00150 [Nanoarchaeota archaeon]|nr:hypothetical protein [Nanoarchaeota archaeon]